MRKQLLLIKYGTIKLLFFPLLFVINQATFAEGSKELTTNGGYRAFLFSSTTGNSSFPFPTIGTMKVYVKAGETLYLGSSAQGMGFGTINLRAPGGSTYTSGTSTSTGLIANRSQEVAGPQPVPGGYTPYTKTVLAGQEGIWEIDFVSPSNGVDQGGNPVPVAAAANWTQPYGQYISAFDVSVRNVANTGFLTGRVFTNVFSGILGTFNVGFNAILNVLTKDGYQYTINNNGQAGNGFTFFANNKGFRTTAGAASYLSVDNVNSPDVQDPRSADTQSDITHKIFFNTPSADLPSSAKTPEGTTWLLSTPVAPTISNVTFTGQEGTAGKAGVNPLGGNFAFATTGGGIYLVVIDVNQNGSFTDPIDRKLTGSVNVGTTQVYWDGLDGAGSKVPAGAAAYNANVSITTTAGEVHFPFFDVERNVNGIILTRINGNKAPDDTVYWDDSPITAIGTPPNPVKNPSGISSTIDGHKWGTPTTDPLNDADFGNNKSIDTWAYITSAPLLSSVSFQMQEADLDVVSIASTSGCAGQPVTYLVTVTNNGPGDAAGAKFKFDFPAQIIGISVNSMAVSGASAISGNNISTNSYSTGIDLANGAIRTFTITGKVSAAANGNVAVTASLLRPADVTDPDATNPDAAPPTDAIKECNAPPSGNGCNNIKINTIAFMPAPDAGPDQTVFQYATVTLAGSGSGTWTQASGDPETAIIASASGATTAVTGLNTLGIYHFIYANANGCADTVAIDVITSHMTIPNIFTPNGDGKNDTFVISGLEGYPGTQLFIFNRWGNEVYRADNYLNNWDGSGLAEGTYYYLLNRREHDGSLTAFKGWVFLKRTK